MMSCLTPFCGLIPLQASCALFFFDFKRGARVLFVLHLKSVKSVIVARPIFSSLISLVSFTAVARVVTQRFFPLMAEHSKSAFLSFKLTNKEQASIFWKPCPSPSRYLTIHMHGGSPLLFQKCAINLSLAT